MADNRVTPGVYRHFKEGRLYRVTAIADYTGAKGLLEGEKLVVYIALYNNPHGNHEMVRPVSEWVQSVETTLEQRLRLGGDPVKPMRPRYERISD